MRSLSLAIAVLICAPALVPAQDRDVKVRADRQALEAGQGWVYNNLEEGIRTARTTDKPLLVVFRCIPCEACQEFDDGVARRDPVIRELMDRFVCVRIIQANALDLTRFQYDFDLSFAAILMHPDGTIFGRYGTRSARDEAQDISLEGLRKAMVAALAMHQDFARIKPSLAGKQPHPVVYKTPREFPSLAGKYQATLDYDGKVARSCIHCHQIREAERLVYRSAAEPIPDAVLFPFPDPGVLGLTMAADELARVKRVEAGAAAAADGLRPGDDILSLAGQPLLSTADLQWVLHHAPATGKLPVRVLRDGKQRSLELTLGEGWRRRGDISWRATTWDLRRMGLGGMVLVDLTDGERRKAGLPLEAMALKVKYLGEHGDHAVAKRAGFRQGDVLVAFDSLTGRMTESELFTDALQKRHPRDEVEAIVLRDGKRETIKFALQ